MLPKGCLPCPDSCESCVGESKCSECNKGFYLRGDECLENCPAGEYADITSRTCEHCISPCLTCTGPLAEQCIKCAFEDGCSKDARGICTLKQCLPGEYPAIDKEQETIVCLSCGERCEMCSNDSTCLECKSGFIKVTEGNKTICKACEDIDSGYYTNSNNQCRGIVLSLSL